MENEETNDNPGTGSEQGGQGGDAPVIDPPAPVIDPPATIDPPAPPGTEPNPLEAELTTEREQRTAAERERDELRQERDRIAAEAQLALQDTPLGYAGEASRSVVNVNAVPFSISGAQPDRVAATLAQEEQFLLVPA